MTLVDDFLFVFGGTVANNSVDDSLWAWDVLKEVWYHLPCTDGQDACPKPVSDHTATSVSLGNVKQIFFIGEYRSGCQLVRPSLRPSVRPLPCRKLVSDRTAMNPILGNVLQIWLFESLSFVYYCLSVCQHMPSTYNCI